MVRRIFHDIGSTEKKEIFPSPSQAFKITVSPSTGSVPIQPHENLTSFMVSPNLMLVVGFSIV